MSLNPFNRTRKAMHAAEVALTEELQHQMEQYDMEHPKPSTEAAVERAFSASENTTRTVEKMRAAIATNEKSIATYDEHETQYLKHVDHVREERAELVRLNNALSGTILELEEATDPDAASEDNTPLEPEVKGDVA